jgi:hypothetical protein
VADGLVQQHAAERVADHDRHPARRRRARVEHRQRLARGARGDLLGPLGDQLEAGVPAARLAAGLDHAVAARDNLDREPHPRAVVGGDHAVGVEDLHELAVLGVAGADLGDGVAGGARGLVAQAEHVGLARGLDLPGGVGDGVLRAACARAELDRARLAAARGLRDRVGHAQQVVLREPVHVGEERRLAGHHADRGAALGA